MPPKESSSTTGAAAPSGRMAQNGSADELPMADLNTFFRVLRFVSAHPELASLPAASDNAKGTTAAATSHTPQLPSSSSSSSQPQQSPIGTTSGPSTSAARTQTGMSSSVGNRIRIPPILNTPLEDYRMLATNLPIDEAGLEAARQRVRDILADLCSELGNADVTAELTGEVFVSRNVDVTTGDSVNSLDRSTTSCGTIRRASNFGMSGMQEMQEIIPGLWCGSYHPAANLALLQRHHVTHVCCCIGTQPRFPADLMYLSFQGEDRPDYDITPHFARTFEFIENALVKCHGGVLVHCGAGISRAPTIVAAYLMRKLRISSTAAIHMVQLHRACASPNMGFRRQLHEYGLKIGVNERTPDARGVMASASFAKAATALQPRQRPSKSAAAAPAGAAGKSTPQETRGTASLGAVQDSVSF